MNALEDWLAREGLAPYLLAVDIGVAAHTIYRMAGRRPPHSQARKRVFLNMETLKLVSERTGIPIGQLAEDACKGEEDGAISAGRKRSRTPKPAAAVETVAES